MTAAKRIYMVGGAARVMITFRQPLIKAMIARGHKVVAIAGEDDPHVASVLRGWGAEFEFVPLLRTGMNPLDDLKTIAALYRSMRRHKPNIVTAFTIKPVTHSLIAARLAGVPARFGMIEGLGYAFTDGPELRRRISRMIIEMLFRVALPLAQKIIVLNRDDENYFRSRRYLKPSQIAAIPGIGVDPDYFHSAPLPPGPVRFVLISRLLKDKGVGEFVEAARLVKKTHPEAQFMLVGPTDPNPAGYGAAQVESWRREGVIEHPGEVSDVRPSIAASHVGVLPSYYREGVPRTLMEAMAMGRPLITTDNPGCRDTVEDGRNGFLVGVRDAAALAAAMTRFIEMPRGRLEEMGAQSRAMALSMFDERRIADDVLALFGLG